MRRSCMRCTGLITGNGIGNRLKIAREEGYWQWLSRHIRQFFSLVLHGFIKPEIEGYIELCDSCWVECRALLAQFLGWQEEEVSPRPKLE